MSGDNVGQSKIKSGCCNLNTLIQIFFFLSWTAIGVAFIVVGAINKNYCAAEPYIPIYMIVAGAFSFAYWIILPLKCICPTFGKILGLLVFLFVFAWLIAGSVWVFRIYRPAPATCNQGMYLFAFSILIIQWIFIGLGIIGAVISCICCKDSCFAKMFKFFNFCPCSETSQCCDSSESACCCLQVCKSIQCSRCLNCSMCSRCCRCLECCAAKA